MGAGTSSAIKPVPSGGAWTDFDFDRMKCRKHKEQTAVQLQQLRVLLVGAPHLVSDLACDHGLMSVLVVTRYNYFLENIECQMLSCARPSTYTLGIH